MSLSQFFSMGGYAVFVWPAYAITLTVLVGNVLAARASHRRALEEARRRLGMGELAR
ncbi:MAG TPA: heme exporter protein CcmD [Steroidobacteraceae bacterium]|nr:heme exporter protein CcmD [Steroidobacteraceae bacterium]